MKGRAVGGRRHRQVAMVGAAVAVALLGACTSGGDDATTADDSAEVAPETSGPANTSHDATTTITAITTTTTSTTSTTAVSTADAVSSDWDPAAPDGTDATATESGCGQPVPTLDPAGIHRATIESSGGTRHYMVVVPSGYDPDVAAPLAYVFHGAGSNKEQQFVYSDFGPEAEAAGAVLVLPDALGSPMRWSPLGGAIAGVDGVDDLAFFDDLHAEIRASWCVDAQRVLVSGMSSGGFMAGAVGCMRPDDVSAIGPVTATVPPNVLCPVGAPRPYVYFHGTADAAVPYEGGPNSPGPVEATSQAWADHNRCVGAPRDERIGTEVIHRSWDGCAAPTDLYIVEEGGHTWPGAIDVGLGYVTRDIDATAIIWETFVSSWR